jgi:hypothetical protein
MRRGHYHPRDGRGRAMSAENVAHLLSAASHAPDRSTRLLYLAEARSLLAREVERCRELTLLLTALEHDAVTATQTELPR